MKQFMVWLILFGIVNGCTSNNYTVKPDKTVKEVKQSEVMDKFKTERAYMINYCNAAYNCHFMKKDSSEHFMVLVENDQIMNSKTDKIASKAADFCSNSIVLNIPSQFYIVLVDERVVQKVNCSTSERSQWYSIDELKNNRY
jgi:hypothetical protein